MRRFLGELWSSLKAAPKVSSPAEIFTLDLRALAIYRVALGMLVFADAAARFRDARGHYSDAGIMPVATYAGEFASKFHVSLHMASGSVLWQQLLFVVAMLAALAMIVGLRTRLATVLCWVLVVSVQNRLTIVLNGGDVLLRVLLFFAMFLPLGRIRSVDAALAKDARAAGLGYLSLPGVVAMLQVVIVYVATMALKTGKEWWVEGSASYYALSLDQLTSAYGTWLLNFPQLLWLGTYVVLILEGAAAFLMLSPFFNAYTRLAAVVLLSGMHFNFELSMRLGLFPWIDIAALLLFLPPSTMTAMARTMVTPSRAALTMYYDRDCGFCLKMVLILRELLLIPETKIVPAQDDDAAKKLLAAQNSWVVVTADGTHHTRWLALVAVLEHAVVIGWMMRLLPLRILAPIGDAVYKGIAKNRGGIGRLSEAHLPLRSFGPLNSGILTQLVTMLAFVWIVLWNIRTIPWIEYDMGPELRRIGQVLRLDQKWNMFAPYPLKDDGWYVIEAELAKGKKFDLLKGPDVPLTWDKPLRVADQYENARWRKFMMNLWLKTKKGYRLWYGKYLCRTWNERADVERLAAFDIVFMKEKTGAPGETLPIEKMTVWQHDCFGGAKEDAAKEATTPAPKPPSATTVDDLVKAAAAAEAAEKDRLERVKAAEAGRLKAPAEGESSEE